MTTKQIAAAAVACVIIVAVIAAYSFVRPPRGPHGAPASSAPVAPQAAAELPPADCLLPGPPPVPPDGLSADAAEMKLGHDAMQDFVNQLEGYQACRDAQADRAAPSVPAAQKQRWIKQGDAAIDEAHDLAGAFGRQLQAFRARNPGR